MRPIDADALYDMIHDNACHDVVGIADVLDFIEIAPSLDYAPVKRGWLEHIGFLTCRCSECKTTFHELPCENYCPNCGALMDGKVHEK